MYSGRENGAAGLSVRTDIIHKSLSGVANGRALKSTALTTENTAMLAPTVRASVETTANAKPGWRRNCRIDAWRVISLLSKELHRILGSRVEFRHNSAQIRHRARSRLRSFLMRRHSE